jgi:hypothetical protein
MGKKTPQLSSARWGITGETAAIMWVKIGLKKAYFLGGLRYKAPGFNTLVKLCVQSLGVYSFLRNFRGICWWRWVAKLLYARNGTPVWI